MIRWWTAQKLRTQIVHFLVGGGGDGGAERAREISGHIGDPKTCDVLPDINSLNALCMAPAESPEEVFKNGRFICSSRALHQKR